MLGEVLGKERGKITSQKVLADGKVEVSFQAAGKVLGVDENSIVTYWSEMRPNGTPYGEGQGVVMTKDGDTASFKGSGVGKFTGRGGAVSFRGAIYYQRTSANLARLNSVAAVFEYEADENGNTHAKVWEWK